MPIPDDDVREDAEELRFLSARQRRFPIELSPEPGDDELARDWTLSPADQELVLGCRGSDSRRWCALQICVLRLTGRFLNGLQAIPPRILAYLNRQLELEPSLFLDALHPNTETEQGRRIRAYLGYRLFDAQMQEGLKCWLGTAAREGLFGLELYRRAEATLRRWQVVLPAPSALERMVAAAVSGAQASVFDTITQLLTTGHRDAIDRLLMLAEGERRSTLYHLKQYPAEPTTAEICERLAQCHELLGLKLHEADWGKVRLEHVRQLAELAQRHDVWALRRFKEKRYPLVACLLLETQKTLLDQVVAMHETYLTGMQRRSKTAFETDHRKARRKLRKGIDTLVVVAQLLLEHGSAEAVFQMLWIARKDPLSDRSIGSTLAGRVSLRSFDRIHQNRFERSFEGIQTG